MRASKQVALSFVALFAVGCGGGSDGGGNSGSGGTGGGGNVGSGGTGGGGNGGSTASGTLGITGTKRIPDLTVADLKAYCDWTASLYGGYGKSIPCGKDWVLDGPANQAECLAVAAQIPSTCQVTVAQGEACAVAGADCDNTNVTTACAALWACLPTSH
jgi:hypothetical protein